MKSESGTKILLALVLLLAGISLPHYDAFGEIIFQDNFDNSPDWQSQQTISKSETGGYDINLNRTYEKVCSDTGLCPPQGWTAYRAASSHYSDDRGHDTFILDENGARGPGGKGISYWIEGAGGDGGWSGGSLNKFVGKEGEGYKELYIRYYLKYPEEWQWKQPGISKPGLQKLMRIASVHHVDPDKICQSFSSNTIFPVFYPCLLYRPEPVDWTELYTAVLVGPTYDTDDEDKIKFSPVYLPVDHKWHCYEFYVKMNSTPGTADGMYAFYLDGISQVEMPEILWRRGWIANHDYNLCSVSRTNGRTYPTSFGQGYYYEVIEDNGISGEAEPAWPDTPIIGETVVEDGNLKWRCAGQSAKGWNWLYFIDNLNLGSFRRDDRVEMPIYMDDVVVSNEYIGLDTRPIANISVEKRKNLNEPVEFLATDIQNVENLEDATFSWDFDASNGIQEDATGISAISNYENEGIYKVTLTIKDKGNIGGDTFYITINNPQEKDIPGPVSNFKIDMGEGQTYLTWQNPKDTDYAGTLILYKNDSFPENKNDTEAIFVCDDKGATPFSVRHYKHYSLINGNTYYYSVFSYDINGNYSEPVKLSVTPKESLFTEGEVLYWDGESSKVNQAVSSDELTIHGSVTPGDATREGSKATNFFNDEDYVSIKSSNLPMKKGKISFWWQPNFIYGDDNLRGTYSYMFVCGGNNMRDSIYAYIKYKHIHFFVCDLFGESHGLNTNKLEWKKGEWYFLEFAWNSENGEMSITIKDTIKTLLRQESTNNMRWDVFGDWQNEELYIGSTGRLFGAKAAIDEFAIDYPETDDVSNKVPVVNAGKDITITLPETVTLSATVKDDGLPLENPLTYSWQKVSGTGTVTFANPSAVNTIATFSATGTYELSLTANDGELSASDNVKITVKESFTPPANSPPELSPIGDKSITSGITLTFTLSATDPDGDTLTYISTKLSGAQLSGAKFTWTPTIAQEGTSSTITFTVSDGKGGQDSETITIKVEKKDNTKECPANYAPVCGVDNNTYQNACFAEQAKVDIQYQGECQEGEEENGDEKSPLIKKVSPERLENQKGERIPVDTPCYILIEDENEINLTEANNLNLNISYTYLSQDISYPRNLDSDLIAGEIIQYLKLDPDVNNPDPAYKLYLAYNKSKETEVSLAGEEYKGHRNQYPFDTKITISIEVTNIKGKKATRSFSFKVESENENIIANSPDNKLELKEAREGTKRTRVQVLTGTQKGGELIYNLQEPITPYFGPDNEIPAIDEEKEIEGMTDSFIMSAQAEEKIIGVGNPLNLKPTAAIFPSEGFVTVIIPCPEYLASDLNVYLYNGLAWELASTPGNILPSAEDWLLERIDHDDEDPTDGIFSTIEVKIRHFTGVQAGIPQTITTNPPKSNPLETSSEGDSSEDDKGYGCFLGVIAR
ncbi:MAG: Ig-like domain-containing protein [bacterium]